MLTRSRPRGAPKTRRRAFALAVVALAAGVAGVAGVRFAAWRQAASGSGDPEAGAVGFAPEDGADGTPGSAGDSAARPPEAGAGAATPLWTLEREAGGTLRGLLVATRCGPRLFAPLADLPLEGGLRRAGAGVSVAVVHVDPARGVVLLHPFDEPPPDAVPVADRLAEGAPVTVAGQSGVVGTFEPVRSVGGRLRFAEPVPVPAALLDAAGRAVGLTDAPTSALALDSVRAWLDHPVVRPLDEVQAELRAADPAWAAPDAERLLAEEHPDPEALRAVLRRLATARFRSVERAERERLAALTAEVWRALLGVLADGDPHAALAAAREALVADADSPALLRDAVALAARHGDASTAVEWYQRLLGVGPEHAAAVADPVAERLLADAARLRAQGRGGDARRKLDTAALLFPGRADVRDALERARRPDQVVEIPFDPRSRAILAEVRIGGRPARLIFDTGATSTTVPRRLAEELGLLSAANPTVRVDTVGGPVTGQIVDLPPLAIGTLEIPGVRAVALDLPGPLAGTGLLGMDALEGLRVEIDAAAGVLRLHRPPR